MFVRNNQLQYPVRVDKPDPLFARQVQELLGGKYGEFTVMTQYLQQGWGIRGVDGNPSLRKIKDLLLDTAAEEIMHVEMLSTMIGLLLSGATPEQQQEAASASPGVAAVLGGMNPQHVIVSGLSPLLADANGNPWNATYITVGGNPAADLYANAVAEMHGRLQTARVFGLTDDPGIKDTLSFMLARDYMHQLQWLAAIEELGGPTKVLPIPSSLPDSAMGENAKYAYTFMPYAQNPAETTSTQGVWASGPAPDGKGQFNSVTEPFALAVEQNLPPAPASVYDSLPGDPVGTPIPPKQANGASAGAGIVDKIVGAVSGQ